MFRYVLLNSIAEIAESLLDEIVESTCKSRAIGDGETLPNATIRKSRGWCEIVNLARQDES